MQLVTHLQEENRKLSKRLEDSKDPASTPLGPPSGEIDMAVVTKLRVTLDSLRSQMREKDKELNLKNSELENVCLISTLPILFSFQIPMKVRSLFIAKILVLL